MSDDNRGPDEGAMPPADVPDELVRAALKAYCVHCSLTVGRQPWSDHEEEARVILAAALSLHVQQLREQLAAANARAEYLDTEALRLRHDTDEARRERDQWREDWRQLRARLDALGEATIEYGVSEYGSVTKASEHYVRVTAWKTGVKPLTREVYRTPWREAPDAAADGHSATETSAQGAGAREDANSSSITTQEQQETEA